MARLTYKFMCSDDSRTGKGINQRYIPHSTEVKSISYITAVLKKIGEIQKQPYNSTLPQLLLSICSYFNISAIPLSANSTNFFIIYKLRIVTFKPIIKLLYTYTKRCRWFVAKIFFEKRCISISSNNIARLHINHF